MPAFTTSTWIESCRRLMKFESNAVLKSFGLKALALPITAADLIFQIMPPPSFPAPPAERHTCSDGMDHLARAMKDNPFMLVLCACGLVGFSSISSLVLEHLHPFPCSCLTHLPACSLHFSALGWLWIGTVLIAALTL